MATRQPTTALTRLHDELDRAFDDFSFPTFFGSMPTFDRRWASALDVYEKDNQIVVEAELPGIPKEAVTIACTDHTLTIEGETKKEEEEKREGYYRSERRMGRFYRAVQVPDDANLEKAAAEFKNGVLKITVPKSARPEEKTRTLPIAG